MGCPYLVKSYFIQYKFITPESLKHSSYTYQKLFRALYGYTQNVSKSNGKTYIYHRDGVLSKFPVIRPGKNSVIIPIAAFQPLLNFLKTGKNPSHVWDEKGDWKAVYYLHDKELTDAEIGSAVDNFLDQALIAVAPRKFEKLLDKMQQFNSANSTDAEKQLINQYAQHISSLDWVKISKDHSAKAKIFFDCLEKLK